MKYPLYELNAFSNRLLKEEISKFSHMHQKAFKYLYRNNNECFYCHNDVFDNDLYTVIGQAHSVLHPRCSRRLVFMNFIRVKGGVK